MGSGPSHDKDSNPDPHRRDSTSHATPSMRRMHWIIYDVKGKHSIIAEHDVITGRRLLVADGQQIIYKKRVLLDRGDTFPFTIGSGTSLHHCVVMIRDMEMKFLYGLIVDGLPVHEYHQQFFKHALYYTFPITVSPFSPTHQYTPSSTKSDVSSPTGGEHIQNLAGIEESSTPPLQSDSLSPQEAVAVTDTLIASAIVSRRKSKADIMNESPEVSALAISGGSLPTTPSRPSASKSVISSVPSIPPTSSVPATSTYTIHDPRHHTCIIITHPSLTVLIDDIPVELHSQFSELTTELFNKDNHVHDGENLHIVHHDAQHEPNPAASVDGTVHGFTCDSFLTVCELVTRPVNRSRASVGTRSSHTLSLPTSSTDTPDNRRRSLTIQTGNTDTLSLIATSPHDDVKHATTATATHTHGHSHGGQECTASHSTTTATSGTTLSPPLSPAASTATPSTGFEYELRVNGFIQETLPPPPYAYFNQATVEQQKAVEIPSARLRQEYETWKQQQK